MTSLKITSKTGKRKKMAIFKKKSEVKSPKIAVVKPTKYEVFSTKKVPVMGEFSLFESRDKNFNGTRYSNLEDADEKKVRFFKKFGFLVFSIF